VANAENNNSGASAINGYTVDLLAGATVVASVTGTTTKSDFTESDSFLLETTSSTSGLGQTF
jgi:hypothetical protein